MKNKEVRLSNVSKKMLENALERMREYGFDSVNFPIFLYELIQAADEKDGYSILEDYFCSCQVGLADVEEVVSALISDCYEELYASKESSNKDGAKKKKKKDKNSKKNTSEKEEIPQKDSIATSLIFKDVEGNEIKVPVDQEVNAVYERLVDIISKYSVETIEPVHFIAAMFQSNSKTLKRFFKEIEDDYIEAKKHFDPEHCLKIGCIPFILAGFLNTINDKIDSSKPCEILMRDQEVEQLWNIMLKKNKRNAVIVGEAGVGKTALVEKITYEINAGTCPDEFRKFKVISLDVNSLIAGTSYRGDAEERIKDIISFLQKNHDVILFIDEVHTILGAGSCFEGEMDLANALKPILARGDTIVIGATTLEEYEKYFMRDAALTRRFEKVEVKEPKSKDVYPMIKNKIEVLSQFHGVNISQNMVEYAIMIANCFAFEKKNPDKTLDLIDRAMVAAKREKKKRVNKRNILKNFGIFFKMWDNMSEDSKKEIAYHEAGHYVVGKASKTLINYNWLAVSIMPAGGYLGVTVYEHDTDRIPFTNADYFIDSIALSLGGRAAEFLFRKDYTSGASVDLEEATKEAYQLVTKLGMGNDSIKNRIYLNTVNYTMLSEKSIEMINEEVNKIIEKAYNRAEQLLNENMDIFEAVVQALLKNHIMSEIELDQIWRDVVERRTK